MPIELGSALPQLRTEVPGPRSRALAERLSRVESRNITAVEPQPPIFWESAHGANVRDVDGNIYVDLTAGFSVAAAGHSADSVTRAIADQAKRLAHGLGDVYPSEPKVQLLEKLAQITPGDLGVSILASAGAEAVEAALKTAVMRTGKAGIIAFEHAYHGLTYGALAVSHRAHFRAAFEAQLFQEVHFAPFPTTANQLPVALDAIDVAIDSGRIGAIIVEPVQGRGGIRVPAPGFLHALRERCDGAGRLLIFDEIYTGMGRTGRWFACEWSGVVPDILIAGKGLTGSLPLSAAIGTPDVMSAWPPSHGEAIHTSTFLGNPVACAAALAHIEAIERHALIDHALKIGERVRLRTSSWVGSNEVIAIRGVGALQGIEFADAVQPHAIRLMEGLLQRGIIALPEGPAAEVLALTPPLVITDQQLDHALQQIQVLIQGQ